MNKFYTAIIMLTLGSASVASADTLFLKNGDIVSGTIIAITADNVTFKPSFNADNEVIISQNDIKNITSSQSLTVELKDGTIASGKIKSDSMGNFVVDNNLTQTPQQQPLNNIKEAYAGTAAERHGLKTHGYLRGGLLVTSGNADNKNYNLDGRFVGETDKSRITLIGEYALSKQEDTTTQDRTFGGIKYDYFMLDNLYTFTNADFERNKFQDLNLRTSLGVGLGYQIYNRDDLHLNFEAGPNYVNEDFEIAGRDNNYAALRWGVNYDQKITDTLSLYHNHRGIQSVENSGDIVINARTGFNVPIIDSVQAGFEWRLDWNNNPATGRDSIDNGYVANVGYYF